jgi:protein transport protein HofC
VSIENEDKAGPVPGPMAFGVRHLMFLVLVIAVAMAFLAEFWLPFLLFMGPLAVIAVIIGFGVVILKWNASHQDALLSVLTIAAEKDVPISTGVEAFAGMCGLWLRRKALALAQTLRAGVPLPVALERHGGLLPPRAAALASVGWGQERLALGLREALAAEANRQLYHARVLSRLAYLGGVLVVFQGVSFFILFYIAPKFQAILRDFGMPTPLLTRLASDAGTFLLYSGVLPLLLLVEALGLFYAVLSSFGRLSGGLPVLNWVMRSRHTAAVLRSLAVTVDAGKSLGSGLELLARCYPVWGTTRKLRRAVARIEAGEAWTAALRGVGLIGGNDAILLESAQRAGNLAWALRTLADGRERRLGYRLQLVSQAIPPLLIVLAGALVGITAVGYFVPLLTILQGLAR